MCIVLHCLHSIFLPNAIVPSFLFTYMNEIPYSITSWVTYAWHVSSNRIESNHFTKKKIFKWHKKAVRDTSRWTEKKQQTNISSTQIELPKNKWRTWAKRVLFFYMSSTHLSDSIFSRNTKLFIWKPWWIHLVTNSTIQKWKYLYKNENSRVRIHNNE